MSNRATRSAPDEADAVDRAIAARIREARLRRGLTQEQLGARVGVSYQQVQKYENGASRLSAGRLKQIADALGTEPGWFFPAGGAAASLAPIDIRRLEQLRDLRPDVFEAFRQLVESSLGDAPPPAPAPAGPRARLSSGAARPCDAPRSWWPRAG